MLRKVLEQAQLKIRTEGTGSVEGYASTFSNWDRVGEKPVKGAFTRSLPDFLVEGFIAYSHNWDGLPVATIKEVYEDNHGLWFSADFHSTAYAQDVRTTVTERLERGKAVMTSIGYEPPTTEVVDAPELPSGKGILLTSIPLLEISIVPVPANRAALVGDAKTASSPLAGLTLRGSHDLALAAIEGYTQRMRRFQDTRAKEGRVLSSANRQKLETLHGSLADVLKLIESLLEDSVPKDTEKAADAADLAILLREFYARQPRLAALARSL